MDSYISSSHLSELEETLSASLESRITMLEFENVVKNFKNNKSPGWDGLTAVFAILVASVSSDRLQHLCTSVENINALVLF